MAPRPTAERPPQGLNSYWTHTWEHALKTLKAQGSWAWEQKPLLDEYVLALRGAHDAREGFAWLDHLEEAVASEEVDWVVLRQIATGLPNQWDRHTRRAMALADQLALTDRGRKAIGLGSEDADDPQDAFAALDELSARRRAG